MTPDYNNEPAYLLDHLTQQHMTHPFDRTFFVIAGIALIATSIPIAVILTVANDTRNDRAERCRIGLSAQSTRRDSALYVSDHPACPTRLLNHRP